MKTSDIESHMRQVNKIRASLDDFTSPPEDIWRPVGLKRAVFRKRINKLIYYENMIDQKLTARVGDWKKRRWGWEH